VSDIQAFLFDLNGTIIDDMDYHAKAWFDILNNKLEANISWDEVMLQMYGKNSELLERVFGVGKFTEQEMADLEMEKEKSYQKAFLPYLKTIDGFEDFVSKASQANIKMAIGSAAIPFNINFVLDGLNLQQYFSASVSAVDVAISKPHPETFLKAAEQLGVLPKNCIVFEDAPKGVEAAANANMRCVVITTMHPKEEFTQFENVLFFIDNYHNEQLNQLLTN
jgi:beta-phosphoglucomutase family hydrolase